MNIATTRLNSIGRHVPGVREERIHCARFQEKITDPASVAFNDRRRKMLETLIVILVVLWLLGLVTSYTMGGFIHVLLVLAIVVVLVRVIQGRRVL
jgi:hypothetical protein